MFTILMFGTAQAVLIREVSLFQGCPYFRGVLISGVSLFQRCPYFRVSLFQRCPISGVSIFRGVLISGCPYYRCPHFRCPHFRAVVTESASLSCITLNIAISKGYLYHIFSLYLSGLCVCESVSAPHYIGTEDSFSDNLIIIIRQLSDVSTRCSDHLQGSSEVRNHHDGNIIMAVTIIKL